MSRIALTRVHTAILVVVIAAAAACAAFYLATPPTQALENAEPIMEEPEEILIGTAVSLTGKESVSGTCVRNAYELAIKEVNDRGGVEMRELGRKLPVRLIVYDDESDPEISASLIERLITEDKVDALLGG